MGTNFYWLYNKPKIDPVETILPTGEKITHPITQIDDMDPTIHIGKRSAAGLFCYACKITLCKGGVPAVHYGGWGDGLKTWHDNCPKCGQAPVEQKDHAAGMVELGFARPRTNTPPPVVMSTSSFSWAQDPEKVIKACKENPDKKIIQDEYDREMTGHEFLDMIENNCMIRYTESIGKHFC